MTSAVAMAGSIKLFQIVQKTYQILGIHPPEANKTFAFNSRNLFFIFCYTQACVTMGGYFLFRAELMLEYVSTLFMTLSALFVLINYLLVMWRIGNILELIAKLDKFIEQSKLLSDS